MPPSLRLGGGAPSMQDELSQLIVEQLLEMGFEPDQAMAAISQGRARDLDSAITFCTSCTVHDVAAEGSGMEGLAGPAVLPSLDAAVSAPVLPSAVFDDQAHQQKDDLEKKKHLQAVERAKKEKAAGKLEKQRAVERLNEDKRHRQLVHLRQTCQRLRLPMASSDEHLLVVLEQNKGDTKDTDAFLEKLASMLSRFLSESDKLNVSISPEELEQVLVHAKLDIGAAASFISKRSKQPKPGDARSSPGPNTAAVQPSNTTTSCTLQIRCPNGKTLTHTFESGQTLLEARLWAVAHMFEDSGAGGGAGGRAAQMVGGRTLVPNAAAEAGRRAHEEHTKRMIEESGRQRPSVPQQAQAGDVNTFSLLMRGSQSMTEFVSDEDLSQSLASVGLAPRGQLVLQNIKHKGAVVEGTGAVTMRVDSSEDEDDNDEDEDDMEGDEDEDEERMDTSGGHASAMDTSVHASTEVARPAVHTAPDRVAMLAALERRQAGAGSAATPPASEVPHSSLPPLAPPLPEAHEPILRTPSQQERVDRSREAAAQRMLAAPSSPQAAPASTSTKVGPSTETASERSGASGHSVLSDREAHLATTKHLKEERERERERLRDQLRDDAFDRGVRRGATGSGAGCTIDGSGTITVPAPAAQPVPMTVTGEFANLRIRLPGGETIRHRFAVTATLDEVLNWALAAGTGGGGAGAAVGYHLSIPFPPRQFSAGDLSLTVAAVGLVPTGTLCISAEGSRGQILQAHRSNGQASMEEGPTDMSYEALMEWEEHRNAMGGGRQSKAIKLQTFVLEECSEEIGDQICSICRCDFGKGDEVSRLPSCNHLFHADCISEWLSRSHTCPVCRADV